MGKWVRFQIGNQKPDGNSDRPICLDPDLDTEHGFIVLVGHPVDVG
jgi:hypothetical protein